MAKNKLETSDWNFDDGLDFSFEADIDGALNQSETSKKKERSVVSSVVDGAIDGAKDTLKSPSFYRQALRQALPSTYGEIADGAEIIAEGSYKILDDSVKELKPRLGEIVKKLDKLVPENQKTLKALTEKVKRLTGVEESRDYAGTDSQEDQLVTSSLAAIFEQNKQYTQIAERKQAVRDRVEGKMHDQSVGLLASIDQSTKTSALYTTNVTQAYQKKSLELQLRTFSMQRDYYTKSVNYLEATKNQLEAVIKNTALPEYVKITNSERFMELSKKRLMDSLYERGNPLARGMKKIGERIGGYVSGIGYGLDNFNFALDGVTGAREQLEQMNEMLVSMGEHPLTKEQMAAAAATSAGLSKVRDWVTDKIRARTEKMNPLKEKLARGARMVLNPGAEMKKFRESEGWQSKIGNYMNPKGSIFRFLDGFMDVFGDDAPDRTLRKGGKFDELNEPTMGFDQKAHISLVDIIPGHLAAIRRELTIMRTGDTSVPLTVYDFQRRSFTDQKSMDKKVYDTIFDKSVSGMLNWELQSTAKTIGGSQTLQKGDEDELKIFVARLARVSDMNMEPSEIRESDAYHDLSDSVRSIVDLYLDSIENSEEKEQKILDLTRAVRRARETMPSTSSEMKDFVDGGHIESLRKMGLIIEDEDGNIKVDETKFEQLQDNAIRIKSDINVKEAIKKMEPNELLKSVNEKLRSAQFKASGTNWRGAQAYKGIKNTELYSWSYKAGEGTPGIKTGPMAQDVRRNLGEEVAPDGKSIDLQSMNGALMAAIQHLGGKVDELSGEGTSPDGKVSVLKQIEINTAELVKMNREAMDLFQSGQGGAGGAGLNRGTYGGLAGSLVGNIVDLATKVSTDIFGAAGKAYQFGKEEFAKPLAGFLSKAYKDSKDPVAAGIKSLFTKGTDFAGSVLDFGKKALTEHLPAGFKSVRDFATSTWKTVKDFFNETKDLYLPDGTEPVIRAVKLRMGFYRDAATGKIIETMDELLACKNDIVDSANNIVLSVEEKARGLYDVHGKKVKTFSMNMLHGAIGAGLWLKDRVVSGFSSLMEAGKGGLDGIKDMFKNKFQGFGDVGFGGKYIKSSYEVLVDIREILLGRGNLVNDRLAADIGPKMPGQPSSSSAATPVGSVASSIKSAKDAIELGKTGVEKGKNFLEKHGILGKIKGFFGLSSGDKIQEEDAKTTDAPVVNPDGTVVQQGDKRDKRSHASDSPDFVGPRMPGPVKAETPEIHGPPKPVQDEASGDASESGKKGWFRSAFDSLRKESQIILQGGKEAYQEAKKTYDENVKAKAEKPEAGQTIKSDKKEQSLLQKIESLLKGKSGEETGERKGSVKEREEQIEKLHQSRQKEAAQLDPNVMNAQAPDMMDGVRNGILGAKIGLSAGKIGGGIVSRMMDKTRGGRFIKAKGRDLLGRFGFGKKQEEIQEEADKTGKGPVINPDGTVVQQDDKRDKRSHASDSPDFVGPKLPGKEAKKDSDVKENTETIYDTDGKKIKKPGLLERIFGKSKKFNDSDGDGDRDGGVKDREEKLKKLEESRKKDPNASAPKEKEKKEGFGIGSLISGLASAIGMLGTGFKGVFSLITGGFKGVFKLFGALGKLLPGVGKAAGFLGRGLGMAGKAIGTVGRFALTRALPTLAVGGLKLAGGALGGIASVLGSSVVLGAAAIAGGVYGAYKLYKYFTRNNIDDYDRIRIRQYGFGYDELSEKHNHKFIALENYLYDGRLKFDSNGHASINERSVKSEELLGFFDIDPEDTEMVQKFTSWLGDRFKPFFLHHATTLYRINSKLKLEDIEKKLSLTEKIKYLETAALPSGPYNVTASPVKSIEEANTDSKSVAEMVDNLTKKLVEEAKKTVAKEKDPFRLTPTTKESTRSVKEAEEVIKKQEAKPSEQSAGDMAKKAAEVAGATGEDGKVPDTPPNNVPETTSKLSQAVKTAPGGIMDGSGGREFVKLGRGMSENHLQGLHPGVLKLFLGMAEEYNKLTGKTIQMNEGLRTYEEQAALRQKYGNRAAKPGTSLHEKGLAIDIPSVTAAELEKLGLMRKYGFTRPVGGEPWHLEPAGIQKNVQLARDNRKEADLLVETSPFRGGGGYAMVADAKKYGRNQALAVSLLNREIDTSKMAEQPVNESDALQRDVAETKKEIDNVIANSDGTKSSVQETASKAGQLPSPEEVKAVRENNSSNAAVNTAVNSGEGGGGGGGGGAGGMEEPKVGEKSSSSTPITGRGDSSIKDIITNAAKKVGLDPKTLLAFAAVESDMNPNAKARTSSAAGLFQFVNKTWKEVLSKFGRKHGLSPNASPLDPEASSLMAAEYLKQNAKSLSTVKPNPTPTDLYLTHFLGLGGARKFLSIPTDAKPAEMMPAAANSNRNIFFDRNGQAKTSRMVYSGLDEKIRKKSALYGVDVQSSTLTPSKAANDDFVSNVEAAPTAPKFGTTGPSANVPEVAQAPKYGTTDAAPTAPTAPAANDPSVVTVGEEKTPLLSGESKEPIRSEGGGVFLDPMGGSRQAYEARSRERENLAPTLNSVDSTLKSSLEVQRESLDVLKAIMNSLNPEAFAKVLGNAAGKSDEEKTNPLKEADRRNLGTYKRDQNPTLDLSRRAA